ncbi:hypothetical protein Droror1_Dr00013900 [Drosera rotundifolia]
MSETLLLQANNQQNRSILRSSMATPQQRSICLQHSPQFDLDPITSPAVNSEPRSLGFCGDQRWTTQIVEAATVADAFWFWIIGEGRNCGCGWWWMAATVLKSVEGWSEIMSKREHGTGR